MGNFYTCSFCFRIITDDENIITDIEELVRQNKNSEPYKKAVKERLIYDTKSKIVEILRYYTKGEQRKKLNTYLLMNNIINNTNIFDYQINKIAYTDLTDKQVLEIHQLIA